MLLTYLVQINIQLKPPTLLVTDDVFQGGDIELTGGVRQVEGDQVLFVVCSHEHLILMGIHNQEILQWDKKFKTVVFLAINQEWTFFSNKY